MKYLITLQLFESNSGAITCYKLGLRLDRSTARNPEILSIIDQFSTDKYGQVRTSTARLDYIRLDKNNTSDKSPEKKSIEPSDNAIEQATLLYDLHLCIDPGYKVPDSRIRAWATEIDKLNRLDGRTWEQIEDVIRWAKADTFWKSNIISGKKLREKFSILVAKMPKREYNHSELKEVIAPDDVIEMIERSR